MNYNYIIKNPKNSLIIGGVVVAVIVIGVAVFMNNLSRKREVKLLDDQKKIEQRVRDEATDELQTITKDYDDSIAKILKQDKEIRYVPGRTQKIYVDRDIDSAIIILQRARYMVQ